MAHEEHIEVPVPIRIEEREPGGGDLVYAVAAVGPGRGRLRDSRRCRDVDKKRRILLGARGAPGGEGDQSETEPA